MNELHHFSLAQLRQIIEGSDEQLANSYISRNLVVARQVKASIARRQLGPDTWMMQEMRILIILQGWARPVVNMTERHFVAGDLVFLAPNGILQLRNVSEDLQGMGLTMSDDLFSLAVGAQIPKSFDGHLRDFQVHLQPQDQAFLDHLHHLIYTYTREADHSPQVTLHLLGSLLWHIDHLQGSHEQLTRQSQSRNERVLGDFMQLVSQYAAKEHSLDFYASQLCLSPRYLGTIVKNTSGRAAKQWIDDAILTRIKIELTHTGKTTSQIADQLCFPNPSFFSKYFKRLTGQTPNEFRQSAKN
ncbi:MAG: AraC family transcriptional regulator [Prevotella sp.]|nr:AraC family transcriptional regulator [Prevotella sp.]